MYLAIAVTALRQGKVPHLWYIRKFVLKLSMRKKKPEIIFMYVICYPCPQTFCPPQAVKQILFRRILTRVSQAVVLMSKKSKNKKSDST